MFRNHFKTAWRNLISNKTHSVLNIAGLSIGLTCSLLIFLWVQNELSVDAFHTNDARLYKLYERAYYKDHIVGDYDMPGLMAQELKRNIPEVQDAIMMQDDNHSAVLQAGNKIIKAEGTAAGAGLFTIFSYPLLQGNAVNALKAPVNITISENIAKALLIIHKTPLAKRCVLITTMIILFQPCLKICHKMCHAVLITLLHGMPGCRIIAGQKTGAIPVQ